MTTAYAPRHTLPSRVELGDVFLDLIGDSR